MPHVQNIWPGVFWLAVEQIGEQQTFAYRYKTKTRAKFVHSPKPGGSDIGRTLPALKWNRQSSDSAANCEMPTRTVCLKLFVSKLLWRYTVTCRQADCSISNHGILSRANNYRACGSSTAFIVSVYLLVTSAGNSRVVFAGWGAFRCSQNCGNRERVSIKIFTAFCLMQKACFTVVLLHEKSQPKSDPMGCLLASRQLRWFLHRWQPQQIRIQEYSLSCSSESQLFAHTSTFVHDNTFFFPLFL